ncbi:MAG: outer membrane beta-barrel protein [Proteobacteria bacterium]|nr:outer membrane beta-barrel protein [Pseudomonadota bacterium]
MIGRLTVISLLALVSWLPSGAHADWFEQYQPQVVVAEPFLEMHTGPGRGYPIFHVAAEGDSITMLKRKTDWFKIQTARGEAGWVHLEQMRSTLDENGQPIEFGEVDFGNYAKRRWEIGITGGEFGGASSLSTYIGYAITPHIAIQAEFTQTLGDFSDGLMATGNVTMYPFPEWRVSPYFTIGTGIIRIKPHSTIVQAEDREDEIVNAGAGVNVYLSDRFILRMEYKHHTVLTSRDDNEEIDQWKAGFSVFF